jgi:hypothetical protein
MPIGKYCTRCQKWYPLFMFKTDTRKFQLKIAFGKVRGCRICIWKESSNGSVVRWTGKDFKTITLSLKERLKELLTK